VVTHQMVWMTTLAGEEPARTPTPDPEEAAGEPKSPTRALRCPHRGGVARVRGRAESASAFCWLRWSRARRGDRDAGGPFLRERSRLRAA
jgi:hypothetical protein